MKKDATIDELDLIAKAVEMTDRLAELTKDETSPFLLFGLQNEPLEVQLTLLQYTNFYDEILYTEFKGQIVQINPSHVSMVLSKESINLISEVK